MDQNGHMIKEATSLSEVAFCVHLYYRYSEINACGLLILLRGGRLSACITQSIVVFLSPSL